MEGLPMVMEMFSIAMESLPIVMEISSIVMEGLSMVMEIFSVTMEKALLHLKQTPTVVISYKKEVVEKKRRYFVIKIIRPCIWLGNYFVSDY